jgi:hypothetical protein
MVGIRIVSVFWVLAGVSLCIWATWGLVTQEHFTSIVVSWCVALGYGLIAFAGGALTLRSTRAGCWLLVAAASVGSLYAVTYWLFVGTHDAAVYAPGVIGLVALCIFTLLLFPDIKANAT